MEITGKVHEVGTIQTVTDSFRKRDLVIQYAENPQFVEYIKFEATQDRVSIFDGLKSGDNVSVSFNLRGRPWTNKDGITSYFNSLVAWRVSKVGSANGQPAQTKTPELYTPSPNMNDDDGSDDLPF